MAAPKKAVGPKSDKIWRDAIMKAIRRQDGDATPKTAQRIDRLADAIVAKGMDGDVGACKEIGDRLDGKPPQAVSLGQDPSAEPITFRWQK